MIIILIVIIVILAAAIGIMFLNPMAAKEPTKIKITSDKEQYEGGKLSIKLTIPTALQYPTKLLKSLLLTKKAKLLLMKL